MKRLLKILIFDNYVEFSEIDLNNIYLGRARAVYLTDKHR